MKGDTLAKPTLSDLIEKENARVSAAAKAPPAGEGDVVVGGGPIPQPG